MYCMLDWRFFNFVWLIGAELGRTE
jgi:hypothetical protein